jgi:predicted DNA-binding protein (UPF0251 family)
LFRKRHAAGQGVVASASLDTVFQREIFFQVDPMELDWMDAAEVRELMPSGFHVDLKTDEFLHYLPELEQEIFWLVYYRQKNQKDIAKLLGLSQPTVSYRFRRTLTKLAYIMILVGVEPEGLMDRLQWIKPNDRAVILDLLYYTNQEMVGRKHGMRQSSVKWIFMKAKKRLADLEREDPERWQKYYGMFILLERNLGARIQN